MSYTLTPNLGLELPDYLDARWNVALNTNFAQLDTYLGSLAGVSSGVGAGIWTKYVLTTSGSNWFVNGAVAAARASSSPQQIPLFTTTPRQVFHSIFLKHSVALSGGALSSVVVSVGTAASPDALMLVSGDTFDVLQTPSSSRFYLTGGAKMLSADATPIVLQVSTVSGTPIVITSGILEIDVFCSVLP